MKSIIALALIITMGACASPKPAEDDAIVCAKTEHGYERIPLWTDGIVRAPERMCK